MTAVQRYERFARIVAIWKGIFWGAMAIFITTNLLAGLVAAVGTYFLVLFIFNMGYRRYKHGRRH